MGGKRTGGYGSVIKVQELMSQQHDTKYYARKQAKCNGQAVLERERELICKLPDNPHLIRLRASYMHKNCLTLILDPWADYDLNSILINPKQLSLPLHGKCLGEQIVRSMPCIVSAVAVLHAHRIKHKDIKPHNILIVFDNKKIVPILCDFGVSKKFDSNSKTAGGEGTTFYQAPECLCGRRAGREADIFSLGCVFLEILTFLCGKRGKLMKNIGKMGFAQYLSDPIRYDAAFNLVNGSSSWWARVVDIVKLMIVQECSDRPSADFIWKRLCEIEVSEGREPHCSHKAIGSLACDSSSGTSRLATMVRGIPLSLNTRSMNSLDTT